MQELIKLSTFDKYGGITVAFYPDQVTRNKSDLTVLTLEYIEYAPMRISSKIGMKRPDWKNSERVPYSVGYRVILDTIHWDAKNITAALNSCLGQILDEVIEFYCKIGRCKINPNTCPQSPEAQK